jgi:hypothetical protein
MNAVWDLLLFTAINCGENEREEKTINRRENMREKKAFHILHLL